MKRRLLAILTISFALLAGLVLSLRPTVPDGHLLSPLWTTAEIVERSYDDVPAERLIDGAAASLAGAAGMAADELGTAAAEADRAGQIPDDVPEGFEPLWRAWEAAAVGVRVQDAPELVAAAIRGMVAATGDPRALVVTGDHTDEDEYFDDEQTGIGAIIQVRGGDVVIDQPFPGGPADRAGARPGDIVLAVDGQRVSAEDAARATALLRGDEGTEVVVQLSREGIGEFEITITRDTLPLTSTGAQRLAADIGYLHITRFASDTPELVVERLGELAARGARALIVDLRGNSGGRPSAAAAVTDHFLDSGIAYVAQYRDETIDQVAMSDGGPAVSVPMVVIVDGRTAGAAEIYAAAIRDHGRALLIGMPTQGDTALHRPHQVADDLAIVVRDGRWLPPSGPARMIGGLQPDVQVPLLENDLATGYDRQLYAAYLVLWRLLGRPVDDG